MGYANIFGRAMANRFLYCVFINVVVKNPARILNLTGKESLHDVGPRNWKLMGRKWYYRKRR